VSTSEGSSTHNAVFAAWGRIVVRHPYLMILGTLAITALSIQQARVSLRVDTSIEAFLATRSSAFDTLIELRDDFGVDGVMLVAIEGDVFSEAFLDKLRGLHGELEALDVDIESLGQRSLKRDGEPEAETPEGTPESADGDDFGDFGEEEGWGDEEGGSVVDEVTSLVNARQTVWEDGGMLVRGLLDEWPEPGELPALKKRVLADTSLVGQVVDSTGQHTTILLRTGFMNQSDLGKVTAKVLAVVDRYDGPGFTAVVGGAPALQYSLTSLMQSDFARLGGTALVLMLIIMWIAFRHPIGVLGPILVVMQAVVWTVGTMAFADIPVTMLSNILPVFIVCVGIGDSVHIQSVYRDARRRGLDNDDAIVDALASTGVPVLFTTMTTCIGLLSFRLASVDAIQQMGTFGALGVTAALIHSMVFLPAMLSFNRKSLLGVRTGDGADWLDRVLAFCNDLSAPHPVDGHRSFRGRNATLVVAAFVVGLSALGGSMMRVYHNPIAWIPDHFDIKRAFTMLDENMGGSADLMLLIDAKEGGTLRDRELLVGLEKLEAHILAYRHPTQPEVIGSIVSVLDVMRESNRATHENDQAFYQLPDSERGVSDMLTMFENAGPDQLRRLATVDLQRGVMIVRAKWMDASSYGPLVDYIQAGIDEHMGDTYVVRPTGTILSMLTIVGSLLHDLLRSFGLAFVVITLMMIVLLRDLRLGLLAMVPNLLPVAAVMGFMGFADIPIDMNNILLASIALGIAVDDTIHFLHQFRAHHHTHGDVEGAIEHAFAHAGRAIVTTSVILVSGFCIFMAAEMTNLLRFGLLVALTLLLAVIVDLMFTPALLRVVYGVPRPVDTPKGTPHANEVPV